MKFDQFFKTNNMSLSDSQFNHFGDNMRSQFMLDPAITPINHGSFGAVPKPVYAAYEKAIKNFCSNPDKQHFENHENTYKEAVKAVSEAVNCSYENIIVCDNATTGINTVIRSIDWSPGDKIIMTNVIYHSCKTLVDFLEHSFGVVPVTIEIDMEDTPEILVAKVEEQLKQPKTKVCFIDDVSSCPSMKLPIETIVPMCKSYGVLSVIDGAHGVGYNKLDLSQLKPDFYVSNLHKWYFTPIGCAMIYVDEAHHTMIQPIPMGYNHLTEPTKEILLKKFAFLGSKQYANLQTVTAAKEFRKDIGGDERIWQYSQLLTEAAVDLFVEKWGEECVVGTPTFMFNISPSFEVNISKLESNMFENGIYIRNRHFGGKTVFRFSVSIYNCLRDYKRALEFIETYGR